jgi:hypothetical protein
MRLGTPLFASALLALAVPAVAQDTGGLAISAAAGSGPSGLARLLPQIHKPVTAAALQGGLTPAGHQAMDQNMIAQLRGDPGFLAGFSFGQPLALSRQPQPPFARYWFDHHYHGHGNDPAAFGGRGPSADGSGGFVPRRQANAGGQGQAGDPSGTGGSRRGPVIIDKTVIDSQGPLAITVGNNNLVQQQSASGSGPIAQQQVAGNNPGGAVNLASGGGSLAQPAAQH